MRLIHEIAQVMKKYAKFVLPILLLFYVVFMAIINHHHVFFYFIYTRYKNFSDSNSSDNYILFTDGCKVPFLDPYDPTVIKYLKTITGDIPCNGKKYLSVNGNKILLNNSAVKKDYGNKNFTCTYRAIYRNPKNETSDADKKFGYGEEKILKLNEIMSDEFIRIFCSVERRVVYEEFLASTPIKWFVEERCERNNISLNPLNVIIVGIDSISKLNFERHFKLTADYLRRNISALEFKGYMKVADNTFPNLTPLLTGHFVSHYYKRSNRERYFDDLDFIWKNFSSIGYRTLLAEDAPHIATYNYEKNGFLLPPTDYFFRPFALAIEDIPWRKNSEDDCFQATPEIQVLFNYLQSFLETMENRPYFAFTWATRLTHDYVNKAGYADKPTYELLRTVDDMGVLNKSMFILMSDHGIRFGDIRKTYIGKIEERMPFLFVTFPKWFLESHPELERNLNSNQQKLVTPFDLHETLVDLYQMMSKDYNYIRTPYGISLFQEIPTSRDCKSAFIRPHWCVCQRYREIDISDKVVVAAANLLVAQLNKMTEQYRTLCEVLELSSILDARVSCLEEDFLKFEELKKSGHEKSFVWDREADSYEEILITVKTLPNEAEFESTVMKVNNIYKVNEISRINKYGSQGDCIHEFDIRKYCYCKSS